MWRKYLHSQCACILSAVLLLTARDDTDVTEWICSKPCVASGGSIFLLPRACRSESFQPMQYLVCLSGTAQALLHSQNIWQQKLLGTSQANAALLSSCVASMVRH